MKSIKCHILHSLSLVYLLHFSYAISGNNSNNINNSNSGSAFDINNQPNSHQSSNSQSTVSATAVPIAATPTTSKPPAQNQDPPRRQQAADDEYLIGVGIADITGPSADINLVSLLRQLATAGSTASSGSSPTLTGNSGSVSSRPLSFIQTASSSTATASGADELLRFQYPSWRDLQDVKLQLKINFNSLLLRTSSLNAMLRWAMPNQIKMQAEFTYANLVVQL